MGDIGTSSTGPLHPRPTIEPPAGSAQLSPQIEGWKTIDEQQEFYDEKDFLYPSYNLTSEKLKDRREDDVVIFDYSLCCTDESPPVEGGDPSSGGSGEDDNRLFQVPKDRLIESEQFKQAINPMKEPRPTQSRARLGIM